MQDSVQSQDMLERQQLRALLLLHCISHLVIWRHQNHVLDINNITRIRTLNNLRYEQHQLHFVGVLFLMSAEYFAVMCRAIQGT